MPGLVLGEGEGKKSHLKCNLLFFFWGGESVKMRYMIFFVAMCLLLSVRCEGDETRNQCFFCCCSLPYRDPGSPSEDGHGT